MVPGRALVSSSKALKDWAYLSASSDIRVKSLVVGPGFEAAFSHGHGGTVEEHCALFVPGEAKGLRGMFLPVWPTSSRGKELVGGRLCTVAGMPDKKEMFELFEENFPQLKVREVVSGKSMRESVGGESGRMGHVRRCMSLVEHVE